MLPGVDGFVWDTGHVVFLGAFFTVVAVLLGTVAWSAAAAARDVRAGRAAALRWHAVFADLPAAARACRHALSGAVERRVCCRSFACGECPDHATLAARPGRWGLAHRPVAGIDVAADRLYSRGHAWTRPEPDGRWSIGLDEIAARVIGTPDEILLPAPGTRLTAGGVAWRVRCGHDEIAVLSPIAGEVVATGAREAGWYLRVRPAPGGPDTRHLLRGDEARAWNAVEVQRVLLAMRDPALGASLADGGQLAPDLPAAAPGVDWQALRGQVLLNP
jgi:hypothetical protein